MIAYEDGLRDENDLHSSTYIPKRDLCIHRDVWFSTFLASIVVPEHTCDYKRSNVGQLGARYDAGWADSQWATVGWEHQTEGADR